MTPDWRQRYQLDDGPGYRDARLSVARVLMGIAGLAAVAVALLVALI